MKERSDDPKVRADELLDEARTLAARAKLRQNAEPSKEKNTPSLTEELRFFRRTLINIREGWAAFYRTFLKPVWFVFGPPVRWVARKYSALWKRFAYRTGSSGERELSRTRAGAIMLLTAAFVLAFTPTRIGDSIRFVTIEPISDAFFMTVSLRTETFYLNNSQEVEPEQNIHAVRGCHQSGMCNEHDAVYFRVRPRLSHDVWKLLTHGNPIYVPDHVVAPIAPGVNRCEVTYYGYRITSSWIARLLRTFQVYPIMLEASCTYLGSRGGVN